MTEIIGWIVALIAIVGGAFAAGGSRQKVKQEKRQKEIFMDAVDAAENAESHGRDDLRKVNNETDNSDFTDLGR